MLISTKFGTMVTCPGSISTPRYSANNASRPRNSSRANANAASEHVTSSSSVTVAATNVVLAAYRANGAAANASAKFAHRGGASKTGGYTSTSSGGFRLVESIHRKGTRLANAAAPTSALVVSRPAALTPPPQEHESAYCREQHPGSRRGVPHAEVVERRLVQEQHDRVRRVGRSTAG